MLKKYEAMLIKKEQLSSDVINFHFQIDEELDFTAGQFVNLKYDLEEKPIIRAYSIASQPSQKTIIELTIKKVEGGLLTPKLFELDISDEVELMGGFGLFNLNKINSEKLVFIGTGTGIAPLRSMILDLIEKEEEKEITLIFGNRTQDELLFKEEFEKIAKENTNFKYITTCSREQDNDKYEGRIGYVQEHLEAVDILNSDFFICGLNDMIQSVKDKLLMLGADESKIHFEKFD